MAPDLIGSLIWLAGILGGAQHPEGNWITADRTALVRVAPCGPRLCGTIVRVLAHGPNVPRVDLNNPEPGLRSRPLAGLQVLSGFTLRGSDWVEGRAYDPKSGRSYKARLTPNPDGTLTVTGCVLFICRSQTWRRT
jgi:uncharacterized protein (DUF2147 family)